MTAARNPCSILREAHYTQCSAEAIAGKMSNKDESEDAPDTDSEDQNLFRRAVSDIKPLHHEARAAKPRQAIAKARFSRQDKREILRESMESDYDDREIHSADNLRFHRASVGKRTMRKLARGNFAVQDELDLHGMTAAEAQDVLQNFISDACIRGFTCVRIVHGKGLGSGERGPVLKRKVASLLRRWQQVLAFVSARQVDGGTGAVYVLLERDI